MNINRFVSLFSNNVIIKKITDDINKNKKQFTFKGLCGDTYLIYLVNLIQINKSFCNLIITKDKESANYISTALEYLIEDYKVLIYPTSYQNLKFNLLNKENHILRTEVIEHLNKNTKLIVISYPEALVEKIINPKELISQKIEIIKGEKINTNQLFEKLNLLNFNKVDFVYEGGQYAVRGGIIDVFSFSNNLPFRIELNGDNIESIRIFNPETQLSEKKVEKFVINRDIHFQLNENNSISFFDSMPKNSFVFCNTIEEQKLALEKFQNEILKNKNNEITIESEKTENDLFLISQKEYLENLNNYYLFINVNAVINADFKNVYNFSTKPQPSFNREYKFLSNDLLEWSNKNFGIYISANNEKQFDRVKNIIEQYNKNINLKFIQSSFHEGFIDEDCKVLCYTDHQIFERYHKPKESRHFSQDKILSLQSLNTLQPGDFLTHIDYGVGRFSGLQKITNNGVQQEAVRLIYKDNDILFVNINTLYKLSKYSSKDGAKPTIHKIGSDSWTRIKLKTKAKIKLLAFDLINLYATRKANKGYAFAPDNYIQHELEASFIYEDTPDQIKVTLDVKKDMESQSPMDRLICGDVGFGKTEIAIRASFKACCDSKQVAVLVPTTVLAFQHYKSFSERLKNLPVKIDFINRFKTANEKKIILENLENGKIDILIGTHAILNKKTKFKDLGLIIIDEEQKFGVNAKETLKTTFSHIDCLTLSATPIPRTLQFSLMGARDLSIIETPPPNRQAVNTIINDFDINFIKENIYNEIERGGQVFFIHNRIHNLLEIKALIQKVCPELSIAHAHGQMEGKELEETLIDFINKKYDVLLATNIIESGIDISNVNTIFINNAHEFGLSDLHQLRGRVGRSNTKAFCFLLATSVNLLSDESKKKLKIIEQFSDLGSGFKIAMKDLDIRGAGNILGAEQSGFINEIGLDAYQKILNETIRELKQNEFKEVFKNNLNEFYYVEDCVIETDLEIFIPDDYIENPTERLAYYTKINQVEENKFDDIIKELEDKFGKIPNQILELFIIIKCRKIGIKLGFEKIILKNKNLNCFFIKDTNSIFYESKVFTGILKYIQEDTNKAQLQQNIKYCLLNYKNITSIEMVYNELNKMLTTVFK